MNLYTYYSILIIEPLEKEIKYLKRRLNKKINLTKKSDKKKLLYLENLLLTYYEKYYKIKNN